MKLWVDDIRPAPEGWELADDFFKAKVALIMQEYDEVSLDHDLGIFIDGKEYTGYDVALFLLDRAIDGKYIPPKITSHSANPIGRKKILDVVGDIAKVIEK